MKKRYSEEQIIKASKQHEAGDKVDDSCRELGISNGTFYNWRSKYAGLEVKRPSGRACRWKCQLRPISAGLWISSQINSEKLASQPPMIVCDNGPKFTRKAMFFWTKERQTKLAFIQPDKPTQNTFVESLNGKFRNKCLNQHWFRSLDETCWEIEQWWKHYNQVRPHSALGYLPPVEYAKRVT